MSCLFGLWNQDGCTKKNTKTKQEKEIERETAGVCLSTAEYKTKKRRKNREQEGCSAGSQRRQESWLAQESSEQGLYCREEEEDGSKRSQNWGTEQRESEKEPGAASLVVVVAVLAPAWLCSLHSGLFLPDPFTLFFSVSRIYTFFLSRKVRVHLARRKQQSLLRASFSISPRFQQPSRRDGGLRKRFQHAPRHLAPPATNSVTKLVFFITHRSRERSRIAPSNDRAVASSPEASSFPAFRPVSARCPIGSGTPGPYPLAPTSVPSDPADSSPHPPISSNIQLTCIRIRFSPSCSTIPFAIIQNFPRFAPS